jgi:hypothetical protein
MLTKHHPHLRGGGNNGDERNEAEAENVVVNAITITIP